jgi:exodeoxyribonuclease VII large subunit
LSADKCGVRIQDQDPMASIPPSFGFEASSGLSPALLGPLTVSQVTRMIRDTLHAVLPPELSVVGEISKCRPHAGGHIWLTLKDDQSQLSCVIWASDARRLKFKLEDGLKVVARGNIDVYATQGRYQLYIKRIEPIGIGAMDLAYRQLCEKLAKEGLFDASHKQPLPRYPATIALVTSPTGAAVRDMVRTLQRRWPAIRIIVVPVRVQGENAGNEIAKAIQRLNHLRVQLAIDLMIVGRGGGSIEDLWAFNEEEVARAIFTSGIPIISAVGHERDTTIADLVADARAATPTHAGEMAVRILDEVLAELDDQGQWLGQKMTDTLEWHRLRLQSMEKERCIADPAGRLRQACQGLDKMTWSIQSHLQHQLALQAGRLGEIRLRMQQVHPNVQLIRARTRLEETLGRLQRAQAGYAWRKTSELESAAAYMRQASPARRIEDLRAALTRAFSSIETTLLRDQKTAEGRLEAMQARLEASNPRQILKRGFTITQDAGTGAFLTAARQARPGMTVATETAEGTFLSTVTPDGPVAPPRKKPAADASQLTLPMEEPPQGDRVTR